MGALYAFGPAGPGQSSTVDVRGRDRQRHQRPRRDQLPGRLRSGTEQRRLGHPRPRPPSRALPSPAGRGRLLGDGPCQVILNSATTVNAEFVPAPVALSASARRRRRRRRRPRARPLRRGREAHQARQGERQGRHRRPRGNRSRPGDPYRGRPRPEARPGQRRRTPARSDAPAPRAGRQSALAKSNRGRLALPVETLLQTERRRPRAVLSSKTVTFTIDQVAGRER